MDELLTVGKKKKRTQKVQAEATDDYTYMELLSRAFSLMKTREVVHVKPKLPPPTLARSGGRRVLWTNFGKTCTLINRSEEHVKLFFTKELCTEGSVDAKHSMLIKGRYTSAQIQSVLVKYIDDYVACGSCQGVATSFQKDPVVRLMFLVCDTCQSKRSIKPL